MRLWRQERSLPFNLTGDSPGSAAILPVDRRHSLAKLSTDDDVETLEHLAEGTGESAGARF